MFDQRLHPNRRRPSLDDNCLTRPHIHNLLEKALKKQVTTVVAGAGYGKTHALYSFLQEYDAVTIWMQLTVFDNLAERLWENFIYAISLQNEDLATDLLEVGFPESMASYHRFLSLFSESIKMDKKYVIVYDDFYLLHEKIVLEFFEKLIYAHLPNLSLVFISRQELPINTIGLLAKGLLSPLTEDEFRFSENEMRSYFKIQGVQVSPKMISDIYKYTDGWIFAINLMVLSLKKGQSREDHAFIAVKENINRLIEAELFSSISKELQEILIGFSLLDDVPLDLLHELFPNSDFIIKELSKIRSFVRYDAFMKTYRIHHLFLGFLREKQASINGQKMENTYRKAAAWYDQNGFKIDAITLYEKIHDYDNIFKLFMTYPIQVPKNMAQFMMALLDRAPESATENNPLLKVLYSRLLLSVGQHEKAVNILLGLKEKYENMPHFKNVNIILCEVHIMLGVIEVARSRYLGTVGRAIQIYQIALDYCPEGSHVAKNMSMNVSPYANLIGANCDFMPILAEAVIVEEYYRALINNISYGAADLAYGEYYFFRKDLKSAERYIRQSITKSLEANQFHIENLAHFYLLRIALTTGNYAKVMERLQLLRQRVEQQNHQDSYTMFDIAAGLVYAVFSVTTNVAGWIRDNSENTAGVLSSSITGLDTLTRFQCDLEEEHYGEILTFLEAKKDKYLGNYLLGQLEIAIIKAICLYYTQEPEKAILVLEEAYRLSLKNSFIMPFIEQGSKMRTLANAAIQSPNCTIPQPWLEDIRTKSSSYSKRLNQIKKDYQIHHAMEISIELTKKEMAILNDICCGLTREEIALEQDLSINTVKSMLANIFEKLGALNTADAVRIAVEKKLLK